MEETWERVGEMIAKVTSELRSWASKEHGIWRYGMVGVDSRALLSLVWSSQLQSPAGADFALKDCLGCRLQYESPPLKVMDSEFAGDQARRLCLKDRYCVGAGVLPWRHKLRRQW